jgi:hypothetical protein
MLPDVAAMACGLNPPLLALLPLVPLARRTRTSYMAARHSMCVCHSLLGPWSR